MTNKKNNLVAYFSMEIGVDEKLNTYAGGLGILAGDLLRSAADQKIPMVGITLLNRFGYFKQTISKKGEQKESFEINNFKLLKKLKNKTSVMIGSDKVVVGVWTYVIKGVSGGLVPVYFLDTNYLENKKCYRNLCDHLYGGDNLIRLRQEIILGRGGVNILESLKIEPSKFHINEGHGAFAFVELFLKNKNKDLQQLRKRCIFTTHSPVKEANDIFMSKHVVKNFKDFPDSILEISENENINMAKLAMHFSGFINGVSKKHAIVSRKLFSKSNIKAITNGVNLNFWTAQPFKIIFDKFYPGWESNNKLLSKRALPLEDLWLAHQKTKKELLIRVLKETGEFLSQEAFTIVVARRFAPYKRSSLVLENMSRLLKIQKKLGTIQIIYAGKAHPKDPEGKKIISGIIKVSKKYKDKIKIVFIENYDINLAKLLVSGADLWLNNPLPPNEASATSGMKAAANGVPQLSTLDGWWPEGYKKNVTGWAINSKNNLKDNESLLNELENKILPIFYFDKNRWKKIIASTIQMNAYKFSSERAINDYKKLAYEK